jgi:hypothetical protein
MTGKFLTTVAVFVLLIAPVSVSSTDREDQLQGRYTLCIDKADADSLEEFREAVTCSAGTNNTGANRTV